MDDNSFKNNNNNKKKKYISEEVLEEIFREHPLDSATLFMFSSISILMINFISIILTHAAFTSNRIQLESLTKKLKDITKKSKVKAYMIADDSMNAFSLGTKSLYITRGLYKILNEKERIAVLLHEYGHTIHHHSYKRMVVSSLSVMAWVNIVIKFVQTLPGMMLGFMFDTIINTMYNAIYGKKHEFIADSVAAQYGYKKELVSALNKLEKIVRKQLCKGLSKQECDNALEQLHKWSDHPDFSERVKKLSLRYTLIMVKKFVASNFSLATGFVSKLVNRVISSPSKIANKIFK